MCARIAQNFPCLGETCSALVTVHSAVLRGARCATPAVKGTNSWKAATGRIGTSSSVAVSRCGQHGYLVRALRRRRFAASRRSNALIGNEPRGESAMQPGFAVDGRTTRSAGKAAVGSRASGRMRLGLFGFACATVLASLSRRRLRQPAQRRSCSAARTSEASRSR